MKSGNIVENRNVATARDDNSHCFPGSLAIEVNIQPLAQQARIAPDNVVFARVVIGGAVENLGADALLGDLMRSSQQVLFADVEEKLRQPFRFAETFARS